MPAGFPKGQRDYTTAKVIVARAFPPPSPPWRHASTPFDPEPSSHGTHVAGIAAGTPTPPAGGRADLGVAPRAYLGNYKALDHPDRRRRRPRRQLARARRRDRGRRQGRHGRDQLSLGEPEVEPARDIVARR